MPAHFTVLLGLLAAVCWGSADFLSRRQSERVGSYRTVVYGQLATLVFVAALLPALGPSIAVGPGVLLVLVATGVVSFFAFIFLYRAFHSGVVSIVAPVAYAYPAVTAVLSVLLLGTVLIAASVAAIAAVVAGVVLLSTRLSELRALASGRGRGRVAAGVWPALGACVFFGAAYVGVGYSIPLAGYVLPVLILRGVGAAAGFLLAPAFRESVAPARSSFSGTIAAMGLLETVGFLAFTYAVSQGSNSLPIVTAVSGMGGAVAASYGFAFLRERLEANQVLGVALALAGVFTLLYLGG